MILSSFIAACSRYAYAPGTGRRKDIIIYDNSSIRYISSIATANPGNLNIAIGKLHLIAIE